MPIFLEAKFQAQAAALFDNCPPMLIGDTYLDFETNTARELESVAIRVSADESGLPQTQRLNGRLHLNYPGSSAYEEIERIAARLEGSFSGFELRLSSLDVSWTWLRADDISDEGEILGGATHGLEPAEKTKRVLKEDTQLLSVVALRPGKDSELFALQLLGRGRIARLDKHYLESLWLNLLGIELACAAGEFRKTTAVKKYTSSPFFAAAFDALEDDLLLSVNRQLVSKDFVRETLSGTTLRDFAKWIFDRRGFYFHQSSKDISRWRLQPSLDAQYEAEIIGRFAVLLSAQLLSFCMKGN